MAAGRKLNADYAVCIGRFVASIEHSGVALCSGADGFVDGRVGLHRLAKACVGCQLEVKLDYSCISYLFAPKV